MTQKKQNEKELLKSLLTEVFNERNTLGKELHANKVYLTALQGVISEAERKIEKGKINLKIIDEQKQLLNEFLETLRITRTKMYPPILYLSGILIALKQFIVDYQKNYSINIEITYEPNERELLGEIHEIQIYKTCTEIINWMFMCKAKNIHITLRYNSEMLEFEAVSKSRNTKSTGEEFIKKLDLIKAYLLWANGDVAAQTNWKNNFKVLFKPNKLID